MVVTCVMFSSSLFFEGLNHCRSLDLGTYTLNKFVYNSLLCEILILYDNQIGKISGKSYLLCRGSIQKKYMV